jgi:tRNA(Ile)-lysidine synthetase-like protein
VDAIPLALVGAAESGLIPRGSAVLLAVSGGADSMALLYGSAEAAKETGWRLSVGHVHHGWRPREGERDLAFVAGHARRLGLPFFSRRTDARRAAKELGLSPEAGARHVRYRALQEMAAEAGAGIVATAHQHGDAVESHVLARERQGGIAALAGPRESRADGIVRPLLSVSRQEILAFLSERGIAFRRDATNGDLRLARNRVRRTLARLRESPGGEDSLRAMALEIARLGVERRLLESELETRILPAARVGTDGAAIDAELLGGSSEELQRLALARLAAPYARPGRPPMTGRERERLLALLAAGTDFRFEAGRRIRFERRRGILRVGLRDPGPVYDPPLKTSTEDAKREVVP